MIHDLVNIGNDIRNLVQRVESRSSYERIHLADLLEHIGQVLKDTGNKLSLGQHPGNHRQMELLSEELYFKLAFVVGEVKAQAISKRLMQTQRVELLCSEVATGFGAHEHALLEEAASHFLDTSRYLRMN
jgi:hypothetical protein